MRVEYANPMNKCNIKIKMRTLSAFSSEADLIVPGAINDVIGQSQLFHSNEE